MPKAILCHAGLFCALLIGLLHPVRALAWGYQGHEVVGAVAEEYQVDTGQVRQDVMRFLGDALGAGLIEACPSEIRSSEIRVVESCLAEVPGTPVVAGTEGPVGREGLAAADAG